nr:uncharacterized protein CTRU02_15073 [Colletotrichum truncatum]KAF6781433.1 hypothetical protein CTRU02_15073 [Colletotrichum truncatum]
MYTKDVSSIRRRTYSQQFRLRHRNGPGARSQLKPTKSDVDSYSTQHYFHDYITIVNMEKNLAENLKPDIRKHCRRPNDRPRSMKCKKMERKRISNTPTRLTQSDYNVVIQDTDPLAVNNDISTTETVSLAAGKVRTFAARLYFRAMTSRTIQIVQEKMPLEQRLDQARECVAHEGVQDGASDADDGAGAVLAANQGQCLFSEGYNKPAMVTNFANINDTEHCEVAIPPRNFCQQVAELRGHFVVCEKFAKSK